MQVERQPVGDVDHGVRTAAPGHLALAQAGHRAPVGRRRRPRRTRVRSSPQPAADPPHGPGDEDARRPAAPPSAAPAPRRPRPSRAPSPPPPARPPPRRRRRPPGTRWPPTPRPRPPSRRAPARPRPSRPARTAPPAHPRGAAPMAARSLSAPISAFQPTSAGLHSGQVDVDALDHAVDRDHQGPAAGTSQRRRRRRASRTPRFRFRACLGYAGGPRPPRREVSCAAGLGDPTAHA